MGVVLANQFTPVLLAFKKMDSYVILCAKKATKVWGEVANRNVREISMTMAYTVTNQNLRIEKEVTLKKLLVKQSIKQNVNKMDYFFTRSVRNISIQLAVAPVYRIAQATWKTSASRAIRRFNRENHTQWSAKKQRILMLDSAILHVMHHQSEWARPAGATVPMELLNVAQLV